MKENLSEAAERLGYGRVTDLRNFYDVIRNDSSFAFNDANETIEFMSDVLEKVVTRIIVVFPADVIKLKGMLKNYDVPKGK